MLDKSRARMLKRQLPHDQSKSLDEPSKKRDQNAVKINALHWLRKGLRLHDNPSLCEALKGSDTIRIIYILDVKFAREAKVSLNVWRFLLQSLDDVDTNLRKLGSRLFVVRGQPADVLPKLFLEWDITKLTFEEACEPFGKERDAAIMMLARDAGVEVKAISSHTLYDQQAIIRRNGGSPPLTYKKFLSIVHNFGPPKLSAPTVDMNMFEKCTTPLSEEHDEWYGVPTMEELGLDLSQLHAEVWHGGETEALRRLDRHLERKAWIANYGKPTITTNSLCSNPTGVSPYLRFGCLSPRLFYHRLTELYKKVKSQKPPLSLHGQLLWREFFYTVAANNPNFDKMECNPVCLKIPWRTNVSDDLNKWIKGKTGFPWIDAIMAQMREEGWIHNLAQHSVACFLTRGDLWISWEEGMKTFEEYMLDADWGITAGTWMWLSCSAFFQKFLQCLCPVEVGKKVDPNGDFIRKYLPILKGYPIKFIHTPWSAPEEVQRAAKCIIGRDYPRPIVNHTEISSINFEKMQEVYQAILLNKSTQMKKALSLINQEATETPERAGQKLRP